MRIALCATALSAALLAAPASHAAESYDSCTGYIDALPAVLTAKGVWCLRADVSTAITEGAAIEIAGNNITVDCNDFRIGGLAAGPGTTATGILITDRLNGTVSNCRLRGFYRAIESSGGGNHLFEGNELDGNTYSGIWTTSDGVTIRGNRILDTGGSTVSSSEAITILAGGTVDIVDNTISGVDTVSDSGTVYGIAFIGGSTGSASDNRIRGLSAQPSATGIGIYVGGSRVAISRNVVQGSGLNTISFGITCDNATSTAQGNIISAFDADLVLCQDAGNHVNDN